MAATPVRVMTFGCAYKAHALLLFVSGSDLRSTMSALPYSHEIFYFRLAFITADSSFIWPDLTHDYYMAH
jgi:hypothetical protein